MSKQLYEEALADVKQLKQVAEDNAKREIIEAVTPRIRDLIEKQLLSEAADDMSEDDLNEKKTLLHDEGKGKKGEGKEEEDLDESLTLDEESAVALSELPELRNENVELEIYRVYDEVAQGLESDVLESSQANEISLKVESLYNKLQGLGLEGSRKALLEEKLEDCYTVLNGLMERNMMKNRKLDEGKLTFTLESEGIPDDLAEKMGDVAVEIVQEEGEEESAEAAAPEEAPGAEPAAEEGGEGESAEDESGDLLESLSGDPIVEIDERELRQAIMEMKGHAMDAGDESLDEYALDEVDEVKHDEVARMEPKDEVVDEGYDEGKCRECSADLVELSEYCHKCGTKCERHGMDEIEEGMDEDQNAGEKTANHSAVEQSGKQRNVVKSSSMHALPESKMAGAKPKMSSMGSAKLKNPLGTASKEMKDKDWYMKDGKKVPVGKTVEKMKEKAGSKGTVPAKVSVPKPPAIKHNVKESLTNSDVDSDSESDSLRAQLAEANLFNAKLLYTNKLLQNDALSARQKAQVIEQLDEATSLREVKLVYESLQKTLATKAPIRESADRVVGTSSRPTSSGGSSSVLTESVEASRWARLAGIK